MPTRKRIKLSMGAALAVAALAISSSAFSETQLQPLQEITPTVSKEATILGSLLSDTVKSITVPGEGVYTCKEGALTVEIANGLRRSTTSEGTDFILTMSSGRKVLLFSASEASFKASLSLAVESQLMGFPVTFRSNNSDTQDALKTACTGVDNLTVANEITISK